LQPPSGRPRRRGRPRGGANAVDAHVGSRVRLRRNILGLSQTGLGDALGLSFQQVQKYERGTNRIGASRLLEMARVLDVPVAFFFDEIEPGLAPGIPKSGADPLPAEDPFREPEIIELVTAYYRLPDDKIRRCLFELARALAAAAGDASAAAARPGRRRARAGSRPGLLAANPGWNDVFRRSPSPTRFDRD
jgi:transcriptional regulator with XRE-family HTH domain